MYFTSKVIVIIVICVIYCINNAVSRSIHKMAHHHRHRHHNNNNNKEVHGWKSERKAPRSSDLEGFSADKMANGADKMAEHSSKKRHDNNNNNNRIREWKWERKSTRLSDFEGFEVDKMADSGEKMANHMMKKRQNERNVEDMIWKNLQQKISNHKTLDELLYRNIGDMENEAVCNYKVTDFLSDEHVIPMNLEQITCNVGDLKEFCRGKNYDRCCVQTYGKILVERKDGGGSEEVEVNNGCIYVKLPEIKGLRADVETDY